MESVAACLLSLHKWNMFLEALYTKAQREKGLKSVPSTIINAIALVNRAGGERRGLKAACGWHWIWCSLQKSHILVSGFHCLSKCIYIWGRCYTSVSKFWLPPQNTGESAFEQGNRIAYTDQHSSWINCVVCRIQMKHFNDFNEGRG